MKSRPLLALLPLICLGVPACGAPARAPIKSRLAPFVFAEDRLEARWSYRATLNASQNGRATWVLGRDTQNGVLLELDNQNRDENIVSASVVRVQNGKRTILASFALPMRNGELGLVRVGRALSVLWNGELKVQLQTDLGGNRFGTSTSGSWKLEDAQMQPTEAVVLRDDFMRASGPDQPEGGDVWKTTGSWKTSGTLGPLADASLSPNPFVFRAAGEGLHVARAGDWFWNNYSVSASVRAVDEGATNAPLVAGLEAFRSSTGGTVRGEIDFRTGVARIVRTTTRGSSPTELKSQKGRAMLASRFGGEQVLAQSAPFDASIGQWHRMRLEPTGGVIRLLFDGREVARAKSDLAQGEVALRAQTGAIGFVDFDDVRVGAPQSSGAVWGEGVLPDRLVKDRLMRNWASAASAWKRDAKGIWWHTGDFWKEAALDVPLPDLKEGQGFRFYLFADAKTPQNAALVATATRKNGKIEVSTTGTRSPQAPVIFSRAQSNTLSLRVGEFKKDFRAASLNWNGTGISVWARAGNGTKIGIQPIQNGAPLPPSGWQTLSIVAPTMERDGQSVIGVNITALAQVSPQLAQEMGLPDATGIIIDHVEDGSPAQIAGFQSGDVVRMVNGARITNIDTMKAAVGSVHAPAPVAIEVLRARKDASNLDWASCAATTPGQLDYAFTGAPTDWNPARGTWEVAERWTCSPQWSFFAGQNDEFPLLWSRFALAGDWTLEAYLATPMDLTRGERSPSDLNVSIGDGQRISSGYSFAFAANGRSQNLIWRGDKLVASKPFEMPLGAGDTHQDWFYLRLERRQTARGVRFKWSVNGQPVGAYEDTSPIAAANRLAFWTKNGAISLARVRLWHNGLKDVPVEARALAPQTPVLSNVLGNYAPRDVGNNASARLSLVVDAQSTVDQGNGGKINGERNPVLEIENPRDGGDWTTYLTRQPFDPAQKNGLLKFDYKAPSNVKLNLYALVANQWREIAWTGGASTPESNQETLGAIENVAADNAWRSARFDLAGALSRNGLSGQKVEALAFAAPARDYLRQGLGGNPRGAKFWLRDLQALPASPLRAASASDSAPVR